MLIVFDLSLLHFNSILSVAYDFFKEKKAKYKATYQNGSVTLHYF